MTIKKIFLILVLLCPLAGCQNSSQSLELKSLSQEQVLTLKKENTQKNVYSLSLTATGKLEGDAEITLLLNKKPYKTQKISNKVNFKFQGDWYADEAELKYTPISVKGGYLKLSYQFHTL